MSKRLPPLLALQAFEAAARHENFAAAAKELNLSQSAVSHRVRGLERHIGHALFERLPRGLRLTEAAKAYLPTVRRSFEDILGATTGVFGQSGHDVLIVRAPISYTVLWLTGLIDLFQQAFPHIEVQLTSTIWADKTASGEADVEFRLGYGNWPDQEAQLLFRDNLVAVCSPQTATLMGKKPTPQTLVGFPLMHVMSSEDDWSRYFQRAGVERTKNHLDIRADSSLTAAEQVCISNRVALIQDRFADHYIRLGRLVAVSEEPLKTQEAIYLMRPRDASVRKPEANLFENWLLNQLEM